MDRVLTVILGFVVAAMVLLLSVALVLTVRSDRSDVFEVTLTPTETEFPTVDHDPDAAADLVDAWATWRTGTFAVAGTWTRTVDGREDDPLTGDVYLAQDPPRRFVVRLGAQIVDIADQERFDSLLVAEIGLVGGYVLGDDRLYDVARVDDSCFHAELVAPRLASPWGRWAEYCFDTESGAMVSARVRRQSAIDVETNTVLTTDVTDADFPVG